MRDSQSHELEGAKSIGSEETEIKQILVRQLPTNPRQNLESLSLEAVLLQPVSGDRYSGLSNQHMGRKISGLSHYDRELYAHIMPSWSQGNKTTSPNANGG
ncbi:hypothetical protein HHI36_020018 [Cryptolaemus montrouzieri]|uniref:Uncharacterized protein n=1 Tax=Cryptolaemus montrouzieri TaxID=559131 RepID=A0ABD2N9P3_9CUCU